MIYFYKFLVLVVGKTNCYSRHAAGTRQAKTPSKSQCASKQELLSTTDMHALACIMHAFVFGASRCLALVSGEERWS